ncbi:MAG: CsbD family protein [Alphaproteobacteria bacterium]|nr:CsbD family protein [Alphaproteobacteria bacterium]
MDKDRIAGGLKKATGAVKETAGKALGDRTTEAEGQAEQGEGRVQSAVGHAKDAVREIVGKK